MNETLAKQVVFSTVLLTGVIIAQASNGGDMGSLLQLVQALIDLLNLIKDVLSGGAGISVIS